ncbi:hypothetical protein FB451DRAFT_1176146 [Mycena latifolia]|nr:hypothetical protein FB451DRAFT_1176146 [Mycena latifolia]
MSPICGKARGQAVRAHADAGGWEKHRTQTAGVTGVYGRGSGDEQGQQDPCKCACAPWTECDDRRRRLSLLLLLLLELDPLTEKFLLTLHWSLLREQIYVTALSPSTMPDALETLVKAATEALEVNSDRRYPADAFETVRRLRLMGHEEGHLVQFELLRNAGEKEFVAQMGRFFANDLPRHLWDFIEELVERILVQLRAGVGFDFYGDENPYFCPVLGVLMDDLLEETSMLFVATTLSDVILAVREAGKTIPEGPTNIPDSSIVPADAGVVTIVKYFKQQNEYMQKRRKRPRPPVTSSLAPRHHNNIFHILASMPATSHAVLMSRMRLSVQTRMDSNKNLKELNPLPPLQPDISSDIVNNASARKLYATIGGGFIDAIVTREVRKALLLTGLLGSGEVSHMVLEAIRKYRSDSSQSTILESHLPRVAQDDYATFLRMFTGAYATHAKHSLRGFRPWLINVYEHLAAAAVKALDPKSCIKSRKRKRGVTAQGEAKHPRAWTSVEGDLPEATSAANTPVLGDITNTLASKPPAKRRITKRRDIALPILILPTPISSAHASSIATPTPTTPQRPIAGSSKLPITISP